MMHCWHDTGTGSHHVTGGSKYYVCCHCGARGTQQWARVRKPPEEMIGHGPHHGETKVVYGAITTIDDQPCEPANG